MIPGVFSLASWDLVGALPVPLEAVKDWAKDGDLRWINRGGVDLMGSNPDANSAFGLPRAKSLYGSVPEQLKDPASFASRLKAMLAARAKYRIAEGELLAVPEPKEPGLCVLVLRLPDHPLAVTVLNFNRSEVAEEIELGDIPKSARGNWQDILSGEAISPLREDRRLPVRLPPLSGTTFVLMPTP